MTIKTQDPCLAAHRECMELDARVKQLEGENERLNDLCQRNSDDLAFLDQVREENERLRADVAAGLGPEDPCAAAGRHVCGPGDAEARIEAALAVDDIDNGMVIVKMRSALRGEKP